MAGFASQAKQALSTIGQATATGGMPVLPPPIQSAIVDKLVSSVVPTTPEAQAKFAKNLFETGVKNALKNAQQQQDQEK